MTGKKSVIVFMVVLVIGLLWAKYFSLALAATSESKKLFVAVSAELTTTDLTSPDTGVDRAIMENFGEFLILKAPNGDLIPGVATTWKVSPNGKEIEFTLRKGVKFHSGDLLTTKDVKFSYERFRAKTPSARTTLKSVERLEIIDDFRFKFHFSAPDVTFIPNRCAFMILSQSYYDRVGEEKFSKQPAGTGPYKFVRYVPGEYVDLERFEDYWGKKPSVKEARFYFVSEDSTRVAKLKTGEVDLITNCPYPMVKDITATPSLKTLKLFNDHPTPSVVFSTRNPKAPWYDKRVRLAMAYAIDWKSIVDNVLFGIPNHWTFLAPHELGYDPNLKPYPYDPKKAKALLSEAGYPNGFEFTLWWLNSNKYPLPRETSEAIASYLEAVGIKTKLVSLDSMQLTQKRDEAKKDTSFYVSFHGPAQSNGTDPTNILSLFFRSDGASSYYSNPDLDKVVDQARSTINDADRGKLIKEAVRIIYEEVPCIPIFNTVAIYAMKKNIDFTPTLKHNVDMLFLKDVVMK